MPNKTVLFSAGFFFLALLDMGVPIIRDGPQTFQGGPGAAMLSFLPYLPLVAFAAYMANSVRNRLPQGPLPLLDGGLLHSPPFHLLPFVGAGACFTYYGGLTSNVANFAGMLVIVLQQIYVIYIRRKLVSA